MLGMCDAYRPRLEEGLAYMESPNAKAYSDFRKMYENKDIQGVLVATPDHWHALHTILACAAGKDVYVEKPMTLFIDEGKWMIQAARKYNRVVVVGTQPASWQRRYRFKKGDRKRGIREDSFRSMVILSQYLSRLWPDFGFGAAAGFDYDMWLGPAEKKALHRAPRDLSFSLVLDYSGAR